jgi:hypothetical protein
MLSSDDEGDTFLRNVGSYKSHRASHPFIPSFHVWDFVPCAVRDLNIKSCIADRFLTATHNPLATRLSPEIRRTELSTGCIH